LQVSLIASNASIKAALEPVKLFKCVGKRVGDFSSRLAIQAIGLDEPGTSRSVLEGASKVPGGL
jgi:hypothetical protein